MEKTRKVARTKNRFAPEIEDTILDYSLHNPTHGQVRLANKLNRKHKWLSLAMEEQKEEKHAHGEIETHHPGFLVSEDTYYVGYIKGIGKIYQQTGIDTYSNIGFAKLYTDKMATVAAEFLNSKVLPFFDE